MNVHVNMNMNVHMFTSGFKFKLKFAGTFMSATVGGHKVFSHCGSGPPMRALA